MDEKMKLINRGMSLRMAVVMSFFLSLTGNLLSGHFSWQGFLISFVISTVISLVIGLLVPIGKITGGMVKGRGLDRRSLKARCLESFISDLIYTPIMTLVMVGVAYAGIMRQSQGHAEVSYWQMLLPSLPICFVVGFVLVFIFQPLFMKQLFKKYQVNPEGM